MRVSWRGLLVSLGFGLLLPLHGCGAGLIGGAVASGQGGDSTAPRAPSLSVGSAVLPLVPPADLVRSVIVTDAELAGGALLEVRLEALGVSVAQPDVSAAAQSGSTVVGFRVDTAAILARVADPTAADVPARLGVWLAGQPVAEPLAVLLARQPDARLVLPAGQQQAFLSPTGQQVTIEVQGLLGTTPADVEVVVATPDPTGGPGARTLRSATGVTLASSPTGAPTVSAFLPGSAFPTAVEIVVRDALAGRSTPITNAFYRPEVALALPAQGPTTGGTLLTLIGTALAPYDFSVTPAQFDFDRVTLTFTKGERTLELPRDDFRTAESALDRLVFTMPPSPDGRPGQVDIELRVELDSAVAIVVASQVFLFANPDPFYGPRGAVFDRLPVAAVPIALDNAPSTAEAPDFALLTEQGGVGFVQLLLAQQNGMFQPFGAPRQVGDHEAAAERNPRDLLTGDFDGDAVPDLFVVNAGAASAVHHVVLGQARPAPPLGAVVPVPGAGGSVAGRVADFDGDGLPDVLLVPGPNAPPGSLPHVLLARPAAVGAPAFAAPIAVLVRPFAYEAFEVADLDDDQVLDIAVLSGTELKLDVAFGNGDGTFGPAQELDFAVPGYAADPLSRAVGLHACRNTPRQSLGVVLAGVDGSTQTRPTVAVLTQELVTTPQGQELRFVEPPPQRVYTAPVEPIGRSLVANLDEAAAANPGPVELVVAIRDEPEFVSLGLLQFGDEVFQPLLGSIEGGTAGGAEVPVQIRSLAFATAFPATQLSGEAKAVFIVHEVDVDGVRERRLSTRLVALTTSNAPVLLPPDAGASLALDIQGIVGGDFAPISVAGDGAVRDLALASRAGLNGGDEVTIVVNDGFGGFPGLGNTLQFAGLLPTTVTLAPRPGERDGLLFAADDSRLGYWRHDPAGPSLQVRDAETPPLRDLMPGPPWTGADLDDETRLLVRDVDGDGVDDAVALLSFALPSPGEGDAALALLRGKAAPAPGEFPFHVPTTLTPVHGNASSFTLGDFASATGALELALTVPVGGSPSAVDGNHVRFYRYVAGATPADDRFEFSAVPGGPQVLLAGSEPTLCAASDLDRDGRTDLLIACRGDSTLRLLRNTSAPGASASPEVAVSAFVEGLASPKALSPGLPTTLRLGDVNGDGNLDVVVWTEFVDLGGARSTAIATYLSTGTGEFGDARFASTSRIGAFDGRLSGDLGDWNRDGVPDLFCGWDLLGAPGSAVNLRVLFGGTR